MDSAATSLKCSFSRLREFVRAKPRTESCEICSVELNSEHEHLLETERQKLLCCCRPCAILFGNQQQARYRHVSGRTLYLADVQVTAVEWNTLGIPVDLAFIYFSTPENAMVAFYPGPAGATASPLELEAWNALLDNHPPLRVLEPDVEALISRRVGAVREFYRAPVTECHRLVGVLRSTWQGISGGTRVWEEVDVFFRNLQGQSSPSCGPV